MDAIFFNGWFTPLRTAVVGVLAYAALVLFLWVRRMITGEPSLVLFRGRILRDALRRTRLTEKEVRAAVRAQGLAAMAFAGTMHLESGGRMSAGARARPRREGRSVSEYRAVRL